MEKQEWLLFVVVVFCEYNLYQNGKGEDYKDDFGGRHPNVLRNKWKYHKVYCNEDCFFE